MKPATRKIHSGYTWMELFIAIVIVALLAGMAIPSYVRYMKKIYYSEVIKTADRYKATVAACLEKRNGALADCDGGRYGIPPNIPAGSGVGQVSSVAVVNGVIIVTPKEKNGISTSDVYILTPIFTKKEISWKASGGGCARGLVTSGC